MVTLEQKGTPMPLEKRLAVTRRAAIWVGFVAFLVAGALAGPPPARAADDVLAAIKQRGTLRVGAGVYPPFMIRKPDGTYEGSDAELLQRLADSLGVKLELIDSGWDTIVEGIVTGKWDVVTGICATPKRAEVVDFSVPYVQVGGVVGYKPGNPKIRSLGDVDKPGIIIADIAGSWNESVSKAAFPNATHKAFSQVTQADTVQEILSGRADAAIYDEPVTSADIQSRFGATAVAFMPSATEPLDVMACPVSYAFRKGDAGMKAFLDKFFEQQKSSGALDTLLGKWLHASSK
jgi:ABC-type amino acid transport substrate-binding protein